MFEKYRVAVFLVAFCISHSLAGQSTLDVVEAEVGRYMDSHFSKYLGEINITDVEETSEGRLHVVGTFLHDGFWSDITKPFAADLKLILGDVRVSTACYWTYQSALDSWSLNCSEGRTVELPPKQAKLY